MTTSLWSVDEVMSATGAICTGEGTPINGASIDTRSLQPGDLFFAIAGEARDGHDFVRDALAKGAGAAVVSTARANEFQADGRLFAVADVMQAMRDLGMAARKRMAGPVIGITGSVGKTGTKEALRLALSRQGATHASIASYNNHWGVPLTLARTPRDTAFGVYEIGMNHPGEIVPLTKMVRPNTAIITAVAPVHLEFFRSVADIADAKAEIFAGLKPGGVAVLPKDCPYFERLKLHAEASNAGRIISFGEHKGADIRAEVIATDSEASDVVASVFGRKITYRIGSPGRHVALNSLAVLAAIAAIGADVDAAAAALVDLTPPTGRGERLLLGPKDAPFLLIDESYNANPASMRAALSNLAMVELAPHGRKIAVLGDMGELGPTGPELHEELAQAVLQSGVDLVFASGSLMKNLVEALPSSLIGGYGGTSAQLIDQVNATARAGDAIMIKGSLSTRMGRVVASLKERHGVLGASATKGVNKPGPASKG